MRVLCAVVCKGSAHVVRKGCAHVVRKIGPKSCALQAAQGFCLVQATTFRAAQGFGPFALFISLLHFHELNTVIDF